jgi:hypothetical protein
VGRIVHFKTLNRCVASIVTDVHENGTVDVQTFPPRDLAIGDQRNITESDTNGGWHWPEREG